MRKAIYVLALALIVTMIAVSCNADPAASVEETVSVTFSNSGRNITSELESFNKGQYYWKYAAEKADDSKLNSGATDSYTEEGARFIHENDTGLVGSLSGFSQGWWNFKLFAYKLVDDEYVLVYQGEAKNQLLTNNGVNKVTVTVNPITVESTKTGILFIDYDNLDFIPAQSGLTEEDIAKFDKKAIVKDLNGDTEYGPVATDSSRYALTPGVYDITIYIEKSGIIYSAESVVTTVYQGLETKLSGELKESLTHFTFDSELNPDIITAKVTSNVVSSSNIPQEGLIISQNDSKVSAAVPKSVASSYIASIIEANRAAGATEDNTTMTMSVNVQTTEASSGSLTFEIGMSANVTIANGDTVQTISDSVSSLSDYVTTVVKIQAGLDNVVVTHKGQTMSTDLNNPNEYGAYSYDKVSGDLVIKTKSFSPFSVTYEVKLGYDITFVFNNGEAPVITRVDYWQSIDSLDIADPVNGTNFFKGWYYEDKEFLPWRTFTGDMTLTAKWAPGVTVTIISEYGNKEKRIVEKGGYLNYWALSSDPSREFDYYSITPDGERWSSTQIEEDITLYAHFKAKELHIWYHHLNNDFINGQTYSYGEETYEPATPEKNGMEFVGWFTNRDGEHSVDNKYVFGNPLIESITLYAVFEEKPHTVFYMPVERYKYDNSPRTEQVYDGDYARDYTWCYNIPMYYQLDYWKTADGNRFDFNTPIYSDITLYPVLKYEAGKEIDAICSNGFMKEEYIDDILYSGKTNINVTNSFAGGFTGTVELGMENPSYDLQRLLINMDLSKGDTIYKLTDGQLEMNLLNRIETDTTLDYSVEISGSIKARIGNLILVPTEITCNGVQFHRFTKESEYVDRNGNKDWWTSEVNMSVNGSLVIGDCTITVDNLDLTMTRTSYSSAPIISVTGSMTIVKGDGTTEVYSITGENGIAINMTQSGFDISGIITKTAGGNTEVFKIRCLIEEGETGYTISCEITRTIGESGSDVYSIEASLVYDKTGDIVTFTCQISKNGDDITNTLDQNSLISRIFGEVENIIILKPILMGYGNIAGVEFVYETTERIEKDGFGIISVYENTIDKNSRYYHVLLDINHYVDFIGNDHKITGEWKFTSSYCETENNIGYKIDEESFNYISPLSVDGAECSEEYVLGDYFHNSIINSYTYIH